MPNSETENSFVPGKIVSCALGWLQTCTMQRVISTRSSRGCFSNVFNMRRMQAQIDLKVLVLEIFRLGNCNSACWYRRGTGEFALFIYRSVLSRQNKLRAEQQIFKTQKSQDCVIEIAYIPKTCKTSRIFEISWDLKIAEDWRTHNSCTKFRDFMTFRL